MKRSPSARQPVLKHVANLWTLTGQPSEKQEWTLEEKFKEAKRAGFQAIATGASPEAAALCQKYGMDYVCYMDANVGNYRKRLEGARAINPARCFVQLCDHDTSPGEAVKIWLKMETRAKELGLELDLEVHRDTCTETPEKVLEIAVLYERATRGKIRFCWDFSHLAVVKHLNPPYADRLLDRPDLVRLARHFHLRPFNGHHCQIPATDGKGHEAPELKPFLEFVDALFACWLKGAKGGEVVYTCPEFGPRISGYGLAAFPNAWEDAMFLRKRTEAIWNLNLTRWGK